ncbi:MAG: TIM barrel protein [Pseudonocardiaceae bacterium]|nr:TIM barrel protein [Pseudonocardiaceae bacterium]
MEEAPVRRYDVNLSILFTELQLVRRPEVARAVGFDAVEFWWPFDAAAPPDGDVDAFVAAIEDAGVRLVGLNFFAGDMAGGDRGLVSWPGRAGEFTESVELAVSIADRLGCKAFNALYGNRVDGASAAEQDELAIGNLRRAADAAARIGATVLVEPVSGAPHYPLRTAADALAVIDKTERDNVALLADLYHLSVNGDDLDTVVTEHVGRIGHVQIADAPGRNEPGTGTLDLERYLGKLEAAGYNGYVGLEYKPSGASADSFDWLPKEARASRGAPA